MRNMIPQSYFPYFSHFKNIRNSILQKDFFLVKSKKQFKI